jgi:thioredoxin 1
MLNQTLKRIGFSLGTLGLIGFGVFNCQQGHCQAANVQESKLETPKEKKAAPVNSNLKNTSDQSGPTALTDKDFSDFINQGGLVLIDFYADWCGPCRKMAPILASVTKDMGDSVKVGKVNVDHAPQAGRTAKLLPTFVLYKDGKEIKRKEGSMTSAEMKAFVLGR